MLAIFVAGDFANTLCPRNAEGNSFLDKFYVDNYMNTYDSQAELVTDKVRLDNVMNQASMPLQEWVSNNEHTLTFCIN